MADRPLRRWRSRPTAWRSPAFACSTNLNSIRSCVAYELDGEAHRPLSPAAPNSLPLQADLYVSPCRVGSLQRPICRRLEQLPENGHWPICDPAELDECRSRSCRLRPTGTDHRGEDSDPRTKRALLMLRSARFFDVIASAMPSSDVLVQSDDVSSKDTNSTKAPWPAGG